MTLTVRPFGAAMRTFLLLLGLFVIAQSANAACSNPTGSAGDMTYSTSANVMVYCDSNNWVSMAGGVSLTVNTSGGGGATPAGSTNDVQYNSSGALAADTGNFTYSSGLLKAPNISATAITASGLGTFGTALVNGGMTVTGQASLTTVSTTLVQLISNTTTACTAGLAGAQRYNGVSNTIDYCTGSGWMSLGPSATAVPAFGYIKSAPQTGITPNTPTKLTFDTRKFDTNNNFSTGTNRFTPTVPGKYLVMVNGTATSSVLGSYVYAMIYKNGSFYRSTLTQATGGSQQIQTQVAALVDMNGTTDYIEAYAQTDQTQMSAAAFEGSLITMNGGGSGGSANPAGSTNDIQYNSGGLLAADTGKFTYDSATGTVSVTAISTTALSVSGTATVNLVNLVSQSTSSLNGPGGNQIVSGTSSVTVSKDTTVTVTVGGNARLSVTGSGVFVGDGTANAGLSVSSGNTQFSTAMTVYPTTYAGSQRAGLGIGGGWLVGQDSQGNGTKDFFVYQISAGTSRLQVTTAGNLVVIGSSTNCTIGNGTGATSCTSDRRLKDHIRPITGALEKLELIKGVTFHWKDPRKSGPEHIGVIAQDVEKVFPEAVGEVSDTTLGTAKTVDYAVLVAPAIEAIKELKADNDNLSGQIEQMKAEGDKLRTEIKQLQAANDNAASMRTELDDLRNRLQKLEGKANKK